MPSSINLVLYSVLFVAVISLIYIFLATRWVLKQNSGTPGMETIAQRIAAGASSFLRTEYTYIAAVVLATSILLGFLTWYHGSGDALRVVNYLVGAGLSALAGVIGMRIATAANVRTAEAARGSLSSAFRISFVGGAIMGIGVVAFALLGMALLFMGALYWLKLDVAVISKEEVKLILDILMGFALGAETIALFARVAGGIYTKAADIGADIVGKVEKGIPEDDPRNPATIADNVGDNVGDVAGMGADLFGSYVSTFLAAMVLGVEIVVPGQGFSLEPTLLPLAIGGLGALISLVVCFAMRLPKKGLSVQKVLHIGNITSVVLLGMGAYGILYYFMPENLRMGSTDFNRNSLYGAIVIGLLVGCFVSWITEYFTNMSYLPVQFIARQSATGPATNVLAGLSVGMFSMVLPMIIFAAAIYGSYYLAGFYGVSIAAVGMMGTTAIQLAIDAFGPIADNAGGIAEMEGLPKEVRERTDALDAVGNTTAAAGKGFAIGSAALTALGLFAAFSSEAGIEVINLYEASTLAALLLGALVPFLFSGLIIGSVGRAALKMVKEVRRQFASNPDILAGKALPDYDRCIDIATRAALREMLLPGILTLGSPIVIGLIFGAKVLGAFLASIVIVGVSLALFQCNAGGAWDNAKKSFEKGIIEGDDMKKGTPAHAAAVVGDTVGDPLKDTSGPAMNILIKLSIIVALILVPYLKS
jgi:K(+)-stimulated pyrophosphate-energized sodium pump